MATEPMFIWQIQLTPGEMKSRREKKGSTQERQTDGGGGDEEMAHLHVFVITAVRLLRVKIYKTDLREKKKDCIMARGRLYHKS